MAKILDGKLAAEALRQKILESFPNHQASLAVLQVGNDPRSEPYVRNKLRTGEKWKIKLRHVELPKSARFKDIAAKIAELNTDRQIEGMIFQLPPDLDEKLSHEEIHELIEMIEPTKDADGLSSKNLGALVARGDKSETPIPATPLGILRLLEHYGVPLEGLDICVLGRSRLVGMPLAVLLGHRGATVTLCHSQTRDVAEKCQRADLIVAATGVRGIVKENYVRENAIVIDVGIVSTPDGLRGDIDHAVYGRVAAYSPVPGGVGPMTVAALMENTIRLWSRKS